MVLNRLAVAAFGLGAVLATGCGKTTDSPATPKGETKVVSGDEGEHVHGAMPHGGINIEWARRHVEFTVDHKAKQVTLYAYKPDSKTPAPVKAEALTLTIDKPKFQVELKAKPQEGDPAGTSSRFVATDDRFGVEQEFSGTLTGTEEGKQYNADFKEPEEPAEKKK